MAQKKPSYEAPSPANDKKAALETALKQIETNYGPGRGPGHWRRTQGTDH